MKHVTALAAAVVALALAPTPARAQLATTTFVSGFGFDTNPCTVAAPCRSFQHAHDVTAAGGQITMLDPAGYGAIAIAKAISIVNDGGGEAGITDLGSGNVAITISAGASDVVNLRGLTLNGVGSGTGGIAFNSGGSLNIQNCVIRDFSGFGVNLPAGASTAMAVTLSDTIVSNNFIGIAINEDSGGTITAHLERVAAIGNINDGIDFVGISGSMRGVIVDSVAAGNGSTGFFSNPGAAGAVVLINSKAINNGIGVLANSGTTSLSQTTLAGNVVNGFKVTLGTLQTFGDNYIVDTNNSGSLTPVGPQ